MAEVVNLAAYRKAKATKDSGIVGDEYAFKLKPGSYADSFEKIREENAAKKRRQDEERLKANQRKAQTVKKGGMI